MELVIREKIVQFDDELAPSLLKYKWNVHECGQPGLWYAYTCGYPGLKTLRMHHLVMGSVQEVDHINRDGLDNHRSNLRFATRVQNSANQRPRKGTSRFKGVSWNCGKWRAVIMIDRKQISLGRYSDELEAAAAYDKAAKAAWGEYAYQNLENA